MERRRFLQLGAATSAAVAGGTGCSSLLGGSESSSATTTQLGGFFAKLDAAMEAIANGKPFDELFAEEQPSDDEGARAEAAGKKQLSTGDRLLVQKALRSLLLVGALHELPEDARHHPGMVTRLNAGMKEMDEAIFGMTDLLEGMNPGDRVELARRIEADPELPKRVAESLDTEAGKLGMPLGRRLRLRKLASHVSWRLRKQPPEALLDEYTTKVRKLAARNGYDAELQRELAARASTSALFAFPAVAGGPLVGSQPADPDAPAPPAPAPGPDPAPTSPPVDAAPSGPLPGPSVTEPLAAPAPAAPAAPVAADQGPQQFPIATEQSQEPTEEEDDSGEITMTVGGVIMGVAAALGIVGGILVGTGSIAGAFLLTGGGILLLIGLIVLIVGAVMAA